METCVDVLAENPEECLHAWGESADVYAEQLDEQYGIPHHCGYCMFMLFSCWPCNPCAIVPATLLWGCDFSQCALVCFCPWLVGRRDRLKSGEEMV
jgi:hypothetical protein